MKNFSVAMALVDYLPVLLFAAAAVLLQRDLYNKMSKGAFALFAAGTIDVFFAGALKATYKLLYAAGVCDFEPLTQMFFPVQAIGFMLAGLGVVAMLCHPQKNTLHGVALAAAPQVYRGTMLFVALMVLGLLGMDAGFALLARRLKKPAAAVFFGLSFVFSLAMSYLSSKDFSAAYMNWIAQGVNIIGQGALLCGAVLLHRAGLARLSLEKEARA